MSAADTARRHAQYEPAVGSVPFRAIAYLQRQPRGAEVKTSVLAEAIGAPPASMNTCMEPARTAGLVFARQRDAHRTSPMWWSLVDHGGGRAADLHIPTFKDSGRTAGLVPAADGSQKPDGGVHGSPARAGSETPPEKGANRDACESPRSTGQSHGAAGSESPAGRGENVAPALGAAPAFECEPRAACSAREAATESAQVAGKELSGCHAEERHAAWTPGRQDAGTSESPGGGPMGVGQAAAAAPADDLRCALWNDGTLEIRGITVIGGGWARLSPDETRELIRYLVATNAGEGV